MRFTVPLLLAAAVLATLASTLSAAVVAPVKAYDKPDESVVVRFLNEKGPEGKKALEQLGLSATKLDDLFSPATGIEASSIKLYNATGAPIPLNAAPAADGTLNLSTAAPQIKQLGTYYLVWKDAPPLVIETLGNPGRNDAPAVTHIELAEQAIITTDKGVIKAKFAYEAAPHTVDNFISLSRQGFYDASAFHRIISGFMIQGGDAYANMETAGTGGPGYQIMKEFSSKKHERGTLSMARASDPNSAGSQFFIMHAKSPNLDGSYSAFGDVYDGMSVVDQIAKTPVSDSNGTVKGPRPKIISIRIVPATAEIYGLK
jgi:peptidyl-prolyl cis-trans isomerase B (cyclophilin B)